MIKKLTEQDRQEFYTLLDEFYHSPAVLHPVPTAHYARLAEEALSQSPYVAVYLFREGGEAAGYAQLSFSYSNEAGGLALWVEEVYVRPAFQGKGIGGRFFRFLDEEYGGKVARMRLEIEPDNVGARRLYERMGFQPLGYLQMVKDFPKDD